MMNLNRPPIFAAALGLLVAQLPSAAIAEVEWAFTSSNCQGTTGGGGCGSGTTNRSHTRTYGGTGSAGSVTVSGWANTLNSNTQLELGKVTHYDGGLGVINADAPSPYGRGGDGNEGTSPEHAVDNDGRFDAVLFDFGDQLVDLSRIHLGWPTSSGGYDRDITVLAYTGTLDPTDSSGSDYIGDRDAYWFSSTDNGEDLTTHGWTVIGSHDVDDGPAPFTEQDINAGDTFSSYWLVSAYNPVFGGSCTPSNSYCNTHPADYFKISALAGDIKPTGVPAPATLALLGLGLAGIGYKRRDS